MSILIHRSKVDESGLLKGELTMTLLTSPQLQGSEWSNLDYLARARAVSALVADEAAETETRAELTERTVRALKDSGLFWMLVPKNLGGGDVDVSTAIEIIEEISAADGSTGWVLMILALGNRGGSLFLDDKEKLYGSPIKAILGGFAGPVGTAVEVTGGLRVKAPRVPFGSGSTHMTHISLAARVLDEKGEPKLLPSGRPDVRTAYVARESVNLLDDWDVTGLVATASQDYEVPEQFVSNGMVMRNEFWSDPHAPVPGDTLPRLAFGGAGHAGVILGLMHRALREVARINDGKTRQGYPAPVNEFPLFQSEFAKQEAAYRAARAYVLETYSAAEGSAASTGEISAELMSRMRQATTHAHDIAQSVISSCHLWGGTQAFKNPSALGRVLRDYMVAKNHMYVDPISMVDAAPEILLSWTREG